MNFILGKKLEMSQLFNDKGEVLPVTLVLAGPCLVTQIKTEDKDGYTGVQIGFETKKKLSKSLLGHLKDLENFRYLREFVGTGLDLSKIKRGDKITIDTFEEGEKVKIVGNSKGKGFQGVVKRHGFHGSPASHGHKDQLRMGGSIGATEPARVFKGMKMPGHMGDEQVTVKNLEIIKIDRNKNILYIKGAVPGTRGSLVKIMGEGEFKVNVSKQGAINNKQEKGEDKKDKDTESTENKEAQKTQEENQPVGGEEKKEEEKKSVQNSMDNEVVEEEWDEK